MSEQVGNRSKRRRVEEQSSSLLSASDSDSSAAGASTSTVVNPPRTQLNPAAVIKPIPFRNLLTVVESEKLFIIDGRDSDSFHQTKINSAACVHAPVQNIGEGSAADNFESKLEVILILEKLCPQVLPHLRPPGHYSHVVIVDDKSTAADCSKSLQIIHDALIKWNEDTGSRVFVLEGGFARFSEQFRNFIITSNNSSEGRTLEEDWILQLSGNSGSLEIGFLFYLKDLDKMASILRKLVTLKGKIAVLKTLELLLDRELAEATEEVTLKLEAFIPEQTKCSVCFDVFQVEIWQCGNGHNICSNCCESVANCPQCRLPYTTMVRNRALEDMLENWFKAECICGLTLNLKEVEEHKLTCDRVASTSLEIERVKACYPVRNEEFERVNRKLQKIRKDIGKTEGRWDSSLNEAQKANPTVWREFWDHRSAKKSAINALEQNLFSIIS